MVKLFVAAAVVVVGLMPAQQTTPPPAQTPTPLPTPTQTFEEFLAGVRADALKAGIRKETLDAALAGLEPNPVVIARDRAQPEATQSLDDTAVLFATMVDAAVQRAERRPVAVVESAIPSSLGQVALTG